MAKQKSFKVKRKEPKGDVAYIPTGSAYLLEGARQGIDDFERKSAREEKIFEQEAREEEKEEEAFFEEIDEEDEGTDDIFELISPIAKPEKPEAYRLPSQEYENIIVGVAEKGSFYPEPKGFWQGLSYRRLINAGYIVLDEYNRPSLTEKGKKYLENWRIPYKKQPAPTFEEPAYKEEEKLIKEAEVGYEPVEREETAQELIEEV